MHRSPTARRTSTTRQVDRTPAAAAHSPAESPGTTQRTVRVDLRASRQPAHRLIPDVDPEAFGIFFSASEPTASRWDALRLCDCLRRAHAPQEMEAFKKRQGVDHGVAHFDRTMLQSFHQGTLERCHRCIHDCLLPRALREVTVTVMTIPTAGDSYRRAAECHRGVTMRTGIQQSAVVVETHRGECQPPTSAKIRLDVGGETTATELESVGRSHPIQ